MNHFLVIIKLITFALCYLILSLQTNAPLSVVVIGWLIGEFTLFLIFGKEKYLNMYKKQIK